MNKCALEYRDLIEVISIHQRAASMLKKHGFHSQAYVELIKLSNAKQAINSLVSAWKPYSAYKEKKSGIADRLSRLLREYMGISRNVSSDMADALVRNRDLKSLSIQKGWDIDGTDIAIGCEKVRRIGIRSEYMQYIDALEQLADRLGIDRDVYEAAVEFFDKDESEEFIA